MGGKQSIEPQGPREKPCQNGCNHPLCIAARRIERNDKIRPLVIEVTKTIIEAELSGHDGSDARRALAELANLARIT